MATPSPSKKPKLDDESDTDQTPANSDPIQIDRNGDLTLIVGPSGVKMQVDANALRRSSKVFDRMLFGSPLGSDRTADWTVELPEDDPEALRLLFHAAHANFADIPRNMKFSQLYDITVTAEKYNMTGSVRPWAATWTLGQDLPAFKPADPDGTSYEDLQRLSILYSLDTLEQFGYFLAILVTKTKVNSNDKPLFKADYGVGGESTDSDFREWSELPLLPDSVSDFASDRRRDLISRLLGELNTTFTANTSGDNGTRPRCLCPSASLGLMIQRLIKESLWPVPNADDIHLSVLELSGIVDQIRVQIERRVIARCDGTHSLDRLDACELKLPQGCGIQWRIQLQGEIKDRFRAYFAT